MKAIIMAGGEGTRLRPLTCTIPKPMVPIMNKPTMEYIIDLLKTVSINEVSVTTYYLPTLISDYFGNGEKFDIKIKYYTETTPLGTGGSVLNTGISPNDTVIVISGDCVTNIDINEAIEFHKTKKSMATLILKQEPVPLDYGIVILDKTGRIVRFLEKPSWGEVFSDTVNTGIYILEGKVFEYYKSGDRFDFSKDLFPRLLSDNIPMYGYVTQNYWNDIGDMISYKQTQFDILDKKLTLKNKYAEIKPGVYVGENTMISEGAVINSPAVIGNGCIVRSGATIDSYSIIGDNVVLNENTSIKRSIIWNKVNMGKNIQCRGTTICNGCFIEDNVNIYEHSIVGSNSKIHSGATVNPEIKIWPSKIIEANTTVNSNMVWGAKTSKLTYVSNCVTGELNREITPEYASILGTIFSTIIKSEKPMLISCDASKQANFIVNSIITGVLSTGKRVIFLKHILTPISRYGVRSFDCGGGIHIRQDHANNNLIHFELFNSIGGNIDRRLQREIEQLLARGDFERCNGDKIEGITEITNYGELYLNSIIHGLSNIKDIQKKSFHILLTTSSELAVDLSIKLLKAAGCNLHINRLKSVDPHSDLNNCLDQISNTMKNRNFDLGIYINDSGENLILFDEQGNIINEDTFRVLTSVITIKSGTCTRLIVPVDTTDIITKLAANCNVEIIKSHSGTIDIMNNMLRYGNSTSEDILQFRLNFDAIFACSKIIGFLSSRNLGLSELLYEIPKFFIKKNELKCEFEKRGYIIRKLIEDNGNNTIEMFEGIKINSDNGWALILPDNERPVFKILTEGYTEEFAEEIITGINKKLSQLINIPNK